MDAMAKIRVKSGPKQYKRGPSLTGQARLHQRLVRLLLDAHRFALTADGPEMLWALRVVQTLRRLVVEAR